MKLYCFPYAGGSSVIYNKWSAYMGPEIDVRPVELAGRGKRVREPLYNNFTALIDDLISILGSEFIDSDYAFFGHSMGSKIAYQLTLRIKQLALPEPRHVFFSGSGAPYTAREDEKEYDKLSEEEFKKEVLSLGGTPREFFDSPELLEFFIPLLRNDFKLSKRDPQKKEIIPLNTDISVFLGKDDDLTEKQVVDWKQYTNGSCAIYYFNGGHFFINERKEMEATILKIESVFKPAVLHKT